MRRKVLWVGDAGCDSGFAKCTHYILDVVKDYFDVAVMGINYLGDPVKYPYPIYPCWPGGDAFGVKRLLDICDRTHPDIVVLQNDPWNVPAYLKQLDKIVDAERPKTVGFIAVDGKNCKGRALNGLDRVIFWTKFAQGEAVQGGCTVPSGIVPLGVDRNIYYPTSRAEARERIGLPDDVKNGFIVLNVNRNQPRKRHDLLVQYFAEWVLLKGIEDAFLYFHVAPTGDLGYDLDQLAAYYGLHGRVILAQPQIFRGISEEMLRTTYCAADIMATTTQGEGWGLTTMEGMACGIPQVVPDWSALGEWPEDAVVAVPCSNRVVTPNGVNVVGGVPDRDAFIEAMDSLYRQPRVREAYARDGLKLVSRPEFDWGNIGNRMVMELNEV